MNLLPQIFRQTQQSSTFRRQGPFYNLKLCQPSARNQSINLQNTINIKTRLLVNRYSIDKSERQSRKKISYSTISYDHLTDPEFYGTKGKKDQIQSYQVLLHQRKKGIQIVGLKVASCRGFKEQYLSELKAIQNQYKNDLSTTQNQFKNQIVRLKQTISQLRRETGDEIKSAKAELKQFNNDLIVFCSEFKRVEENYKKCVQNLQKPIQ